VGLLSECTYRGGEGGAIVCNGALGLHSSVSQVLGLVRESATLSRSRYAFILPDSQGPAVTLHRPWRSRVVIVSGLTPTRVTRDALLA